MRTAFNNRSLVHLAWVALLAGGLDGCGGGGGGGDSTSPPAAAPATLTITSVNSDAVAHSTAAGVLALPIATLSQAKVSLTGDGPASASAQNPSALLRQFRAGAASGGRKRALEVVDTGEVPCNWGGTVAIVINDADNSGDESPGDVESIVFKNCLASRDQTYDGAITMRVAAVTADSTTYDVSLAQLSYVTPNHSLTSNGSYVAAVVWSGLVQNTTYTVDGSITIAVTTHVPFTDTVTLQNGFVLHEQIDSGSGQNLLSATGMIESAAAGGSVAVATRSDLVTWGQTGLYPTAGVLNVAGKAGALSITALSTSSVCVDVDTDDDGEIEQTRTPTWDWLL